MKTSDRVENILKVSHAARNSDTELIIIYMQKSGMNLSSDQTETFRKLPSMETITRVRRQLQEKGMYEADDSVNEARYKKFQTTKQNIPHEDAGVLLDKLGYRIAEDDPWNK